MAKLIKGVNDLATLYPDLVKEWNFEKNDIRPDEITYGSGIKVWWTCSKCANNFEQSIANRVRGRGCPKCGKIKQGKSRSTPKRYEDSLEYQYPNLAKEWNYAKNTILPSEIVVGSNKEVWWTCNKCGNIWKTPISRRTIEKRGCPKCGRIKQGKSHSTPTKYEDSLAYQYSYLLKEWDYDKNTLKPTEVKSVSAKKVWWKCSKCGYSWQAQIASRKNSKSCPKCADKQRGISHSTPKKYEDSFEYNYPKIAKEWDYEKNDIVPSKIVKHSGRIVWWKCSKCNNSWKASIYNRAKGTGCPICSASKTEQLVDEILKGKTYIREWVQKIGKINRRYDFLILSNKVVIEIDGQQHFMEIKGFDREYKQEIIADTQKNNHLLRFGIPLLRLPGLDMFKRGTSLTEDDYLWYLHQHINYFLQTRKVPKDIIQFYKENSENNYAEVAEKMNELVEKGQI